MLSMQWSWLDLERGTLTVPDWADKAKQGFSVFLAAEVVGLLKKRQPNAASCWVFPNPKTGKPYHSCRAAWEMVRKRAGLPTLRTHDLRHTFASMMLESGADIIDVQAALAHTQLKTTTVYLHLLDSRKQNKANAAVQATGIFA